MAPMLVQEGPPLVPFREVLMDVEGDGAALVQEDSAMAGNAAVSPVGVAVEQAA